ncbi:MAG TPA: enolase C-terminal domain-like protein [Polyangia bacterium]|jgi:L-alanine-DL-glutamate epimerase-like enolase superfamily enzyme
MATARVDALEVAAYTIPTDAPESDGTLAWEATTLVRVEVAGGGKRGWGWSYADTATARLVADKLRREVVGRSAMDVGGANAAMMRAVRNLGREGIAAMAVSAVDVALWDLKARLLGVSLVDLFGALRDAAPVYGSGGFCSYSDATLQAQLGGWVEEGIARVKMKVGREPARDRARVKAARAAAGSAELFVDANGAYTQKQARALGHAFADESDVRWFEEPVSSDDLPGLAELARALPMDVAAGEYGYTPWYFRAMLAAGAVDVLQADATRCGGYTGFLAAAALCDAFERPLSAHCAPSLHAPVACAAPRLVHIEYFHDHARIERMLLDGFVEPRAGALHVDRAKPGHGYDWKSKDAERFRV